MIIGNHKLFLISKEAFKDGKKALNIARNMNPGMDIISVWEAGRKSPIYRQFRIDMLTGRDKLYWYFVICKFDKWGNMKY